MNIYVSYYYLLLAPEVIIRKPYNYSFDWWGFGILIYELLHGHVSTNLSYNI